MRRTVFYPACARWPSAGGCQVVQTCCFNFYEITICRLLWDGCLLNRYNPGDISGTVVGERLDFRSDNDNVNLLIAWDCGSWESGPCLLGMYAIEALIPHKTAVSRWLWGGSSQMFSSYVRFTQCKCSILRVYRLSGPEKDDHLPVKCILSMFL